MDKRIKEMAGKKFGRLTVIKFIETKGRSGHAYWLCKCRCGKEKIIDGSKLRCGDIISCGCYNAERASKWLRKYATSDRHKGKGNPAFLHGETKTRFFMIYQGAWNRCNVKSGGNYYLYGGRGIKFLWKTYLEFKKDMYKSYLKHIEKYSEKQTTLDRVDNNGNYCKKNCKWATYKEQGENRRSNRMVSCKGKIVCVAKANEMMKLPFATIQKRLSLGWSEKDAVNRPARNYLTRQSNEIARSPVKNRKRSPR